MKVLNKIPYIAYYEGENKPMCIDSMTTFLVVGFSHSEVSLVTKKPSHIEEGMVGMDEQGLMTIHVHPPIFESMFTIVEDF